MPDLPKRPCTYPGCGALVSDRKQRCAAHRVVTAKSVDSMRLNANQRGYTWQWRKASKLYLKAHPLCECDECQAGAVRVRAAVLVDHVVPHRGDMQLFWNQSNWQAMAKECHDRKTATEDGGFGNASRGATSKG